MSVLLLKRSLFRYQEIGIEHNIVTVKATKNAIFDLVSGTSIALCSLVDPFPPLKWDRALPKKRLTNGSRECYLQQKEFDGFMQLSKTKRSIAWKKRVALTVILLVSMNGTERCR